MAKGSSSVLRPGPRALSRLRRCARRDGSVRGFAASEERPRNAAPATARGPAPGVLSRALDLGGFGEPRDLGRHGAYALREGEEATSRPPLRRFRRGGMKGHADDSDLRERFARLRADDRARSPEFSRLIDPAPRRHGRRGRPVPAVRVGLAIGSIAVIVTLIFWPGGVPPSPPEGLWDSPGGTPFELAGVWRSPTDFLLETPGLELLRDVPAVGPGVAPRPTGGGKHP